MRPAAIRAVNVGGIHHRAGRTQRLRYVFLTPDEEAAAARARRARASRSRRRTCRPRGRCRSTNCCAGQRRHERRRHRRARRLLGGVLGLDTVSFPQAMLSRPLVAATLAGAFVGDARSRAARRRDARAVRARDAAVRRVAVSRVGLGAVVGGALFAQGAVRIDAGRLTTSRAGRARHGVGRRLDDGAAAPAQRDAGRGAAHDALAAGARGTVIGLQLAGLTADLVRGIVLTAVGLVAVRAAADRRRSRRGAADAPLSRARGRRRRGALSRWRGVEALPRRAAASRWQFLVGAGGRPRAW